MTSSAASSRLVSLLANISPVVEEVKESGSEDFERVCKDVSGHDGSFPKFSEFAKEWESICESFSGRFKSCLVVSVVVVGVNYGISSVTGIMENPLARLLSMAPAVFLFYSLLTSSFFSYVIPFVQNPLCGLGMISSASERGENGRKMFINTWKKAENLPTIYMRLSLLASVGVHALTLNKDIYLHPRAFEACDLVVWSAFLLSSIPVISAFNTLHREVSRALESNGSAYAKLRKA